MTAKSIGIGVSESWISIKMLGYSSIFLMTFDVSLLFN